MAQGEHVSEAFAKIAQDLFEKFNMKIDELVEDLKELSKTVRSLELTVHNSPCESIVNHLKYHQELQARQEDERVIRKKFIYNVATIVIGTGIVTAVGAIIYAFKNGF